MLWFIFCNSELLLQKDSDGTCRIPESSTSPIDLPSDTIVHTIPPMEDGSDVRTCGVDTPVKKDGYEMCPLRQSFFKLPLSHYLKAGKCREIVYWDKNTQYCGVCGNPMTMHTEISKQCTVCGKVVWPSLAIAVIILVHRGDEILMVQSRNFQGKYFGLVAGFVETGESVEEAAVREIREETGIEVKNLTYARSQPWPYPSVLMIGFTAEYASGDIRLQYSELAEGGWYHRDHLPQLPGEMGVARQMIEQWLQETGRTTDIDTKEAK